MADTTSTPTLTPQPAELDPSHASFSYETSPTLYLFTSLTAGSSQIITATSRLETILKAHRIPFRAIDCATDEKARRIWSRRAGKRKLPGLVREGWVLAGMEEVEEWNEDGVLKEQLKEAQEANEIERDSERESAAASPAPGAQSSAAGIATGSQKTLPIREAQTSAGSSAPVPVPTHQLPTHPKDDISSLHSTSPSAGLPALYHPPPPQPSTATSTSTSTSASQTTTTTLPPDGIQFPVPVPVKRPTTIAFGRPQDSFTGSIRGGSALATPLEDPITASAGPATKSGLEAVTSNPDSLSREESAGERGRGRLRDLAPGVLPEAAAGVKAEEGSAGKSGIGAAVGGASATNRNAARVKFEEDQLKGDARDGRAAEDSVGD